MTWSMQKKLDTNKIKIDEKSKNTETIKKIQKMQKIFLFNTLGT